MADLKVIEEGNLDMAELEAEVDADMRKEFVAEAKKLLIGKRREIGRAKKIVRNLEREYDVLVLEISDDG